MAANTLEAANAKANVPVSGHGWGGNVKAAYGSVSVDTGSLEQGDVWKMCRTPKGATIIGVELHATDMDTNGTPALALDVGDADDVDRLIAASTVGQTGGVDRKMALSTGFGFKTTKETVWQVSVKTAAATAAAGTAALVVYYVMP